MAKHLTTFVLDRIAGTEEARVRCRVKWEGSRQIIALNVGYRVNVTRWDSVAQRCALRSFHGSRRTPAAEINTELDRYADAVDAAFASFDKRGEVPTKDELREAVAETLGRDVPKELTVIQAFDQFITERGERNCWTYRRYQKFWGIKRRLLEFNERPTWEDFREDRLYEFVAYLRTRTCVNNRAEEGVSTVKDATIEKNISELKWFLKWADQKGLLPYNDYIHFKPKFQKIDDPIIFLEWDELMTLMNYEFPESEPVLRSVRDVFCFCAFTSLRYSDVHALRWADVTDTHIKVTTKKTNDALVIELNDYSSEILGRYVDVALPDDKVFPVLSNQKMNVRIKEVCKLCGLSKLVRVSEYQNGQRVDKLFPKWSLMTTHAGRRTFISNALMMGIPPNVVMRWTGHHDYNSMKPYIAIADQIRAKEMEKFNRPT